MEAILFVGGFTLIVVFLAWVLNTIFLLKLAKYTYTVFVPIGFLMWCYEGIMKSNFFPPENNSSIFLIVTLLNATLTYFLIKVYKRRLNETNYLKSLDRDSERNFNYLLVMLVGSGNFLGITFLLGLFGVIDKAIY